MRNSLQYSEFPQGDPRPAVMVISHERSGTHFLMNTLAECFGYSTTPWVDFDHGSIAVNFYSAASIRRFFNDVSCTRLANVIKCHHPLPFFTGNVDLVCETTRILYIYRHPLTTLRSYWKLIERAGWCEGPRGLTCNEFLRAPPMGYSMRYQMEQKPSMLHRWADHVDEWLKLAGERKEIFPVRYESLDSRFGETVERIGTWLDIRPSEVRRPDRYRNVVMPTKDIDYGNECRYSAESLAFVRETAGPLLSRIGYSDLSIND